MCGYDSNPKNYIYLQLVDFVYAYLHVGYVCLFLLILQRTFGS